MQIDPRQFNVLTQAHAARFEARACEFLQVEFPAVAGKSDEQRLLRFIAHGRRRAELHGFTSERNIVLYCLAMMHLGPMFDEEAAFAHLAPQLDPASPAGPDARLRVLLEEARRHPGPGQAHAS
jgi:hypothetical protein